MTNEEFDKINHGAAASLEFLQKSMTELLEANQNLKYERDVYKAKYEQEVELRRLVNEALPAPTTES